MKAEVKMQVRFPIQIRDLLAEDARNNHRSMNGQLIAILTNHFQMLKLDTEAESAGRRTRRRS